MDQHHSGVRKETNLEERIYPPQKNKRFIKYINNIIMFRSNFLYIIIVYNEKIKTKKINQEKNETEKILLTLI